MAKSVTTSNMALVGSEIDKKVRQANAENEPAWIGCGKEKGVEVFRIENFNVKPYPKELYGKFYSGDSYIVLHTHGEGVYDVYYWLGSTTSQDEAGTAAIKVIELDDLLGGKPIQHRETQFNETGAFFELFDNDVQYLEGGVDSGFKKTSAADLKANRPTRLFHFRSTGGIKSTKMFQRPVSADSLNEDDVFLLDDDRDLYIFQGTTASPGERMLASTTANRIASNRCRGCKVHVVTSSDAPREFWTLLKCPNGDKVDIKAKPDATSERRTTKSLYKISDAEEAGNIKFTPVIENSNEKIPRSALKTEDAFVIDCGAEIFVWIGAGASGGERANASQYATRFLQGTSSSSAPPVPITRVLEGTEGAYFMEITKDE